jgi:hypothetical protein
MSSNLKHFFSFISITLVSPQNSKDSFERVYSQEYLTYIQLLLLFL